MKAVVFDFGNVLGFFDYRLTLDRMAAHTDMPKGEMFAAVHDSQLEDAYESGRIGSKEFLQRIRALWGLRCDEGALAEAWSDIFRPNWDVCALVESLKPRFRLLLGSNTNDLHSRQFRRQFADTLQHFDHLVLSHEIGMRKPQAGFFDHCRMLARCEPEECLFIDDLPDNIGGARACGWNGIVYQNFPDLQLHLRELGVL